MKSRQLTWLLLIYFIFNLQCFASASNLANTTSKKVFILLRTEQNPDVLNNFKSLVESNLNYNNVKAHIFSYRVTEPLPQMKIFKTAYQENFDFILLIDQVANYNVGFSNRKVNIGGKFQIQSYNLKSTEPSWTNHGDKNCNISVIESVEQFSKEIINTISPNRSIKQSSYSNKESKEKKDANDSNQNIEEIIIPKYKLNEIKLLETQIRYQKTKTKRVLTQIEHLILKTEKDIEIEIEKTKNIAFEIQKLKE